MPEFLSDSVTLGTLVVAGVSYASGLWLGWSIWSKSEVKEKEKERKRTEWSRDLSTWGDPEAWVKRLKKEIEDD